MVAGSERHSLVNLPASVDKALAKQLHRKRTILFGTTALNIVATDTDSKGDAVVYFLPNENKHDRQTIKFGSVTPITQDGYFLTADHNLDQANNYSIIHSAKNETHKKQVRVIWRDTQSDLALIHADINTPDFYRWSTQDLAKNDQVLVSATKGKPSPGTLLTDIKGNYHPDYEAQVVLHNGRVIPGDSGSPLVDGAGQLVGINVASMSHISKAVRPAIANIEALIEADRTGSEPNYTFENSDLVSDDARNHVEFIDVKVTPVSRTLTLQ